MDYCSARIHPTARIAESAVVVGDVEVGERCTVLWNAVLRGDCSGRIVVGKNTNIQENACVHVNQGGQTVIGSNVTVGHGAIVHGCTIGNGSLVGMGAVVIDGARVGKHCLVGAGALLYLNPPIYRVSVNGVEHMIHTGMTLQDLVDEGWATPAAGDLIAVDGSVAQEGGGDKFEANLNGTVTSDPATTVPRHSTVEFSDGNDVDEDYTETTEAIAHGEGGQDVSSPATYYAGPIHVLSDGQDGEQVTKTGKVSGKTVTEVTKQPVDSGYSAYSVNTNGDKVIALTFDDGPWPTTTSEILDVLKENDAHATFFEIGNQVAENADVVKRIAAEGNQIGSHTWDHASGSGQGVNLTFMTADEQRDEVTKGFSAIEDVLGTSVPHVLRAPGGNYYGSLVENLKDLVDVEVGWNVDTEDWRRPGADKIAEAIMSAQPGNVVLMHDGGGDRSQTVEALKIALPKLKAEGYSFVTIDELMSTYGSSGSGSN